MDRPHSPDRQYSPERHHSPDRPVAGRKLSGRNYEQPDQRERSNSRNPLPDRRLSSNRNQGGFEMTNRNQGGFEMTNRNQGGFEITNRHPEDIEGRRRSQQRNPNESEMGRRLSNRNPDEMGIGWRMPPRDANDNGTERRMSNRNPDEFGTGWRMRPQDPSDNEMAQKRMPNMTPVVIELERRLSQRQGWALALWFPMRIARFLLAKERNSDSLPSLFCNKQCEQIAHSRSLKKSNCEQIAIVALLKRETRAICFKKLGNHSCDSLLKSYCEQFACVAIFKERFILVTLLKRATNAICSQLLFLKERQDRMAHDPSLRREILSERVKSERANSQRCPKESGREDGCGRVV